MGEVESRSPLVRAKASDREISARISRWSLRSGSDEGRYPSTGMSGITSVVSIETSSRACANNEVHDHDPHRLDSNSALLRDRRRAGETARLVHDARVQRRAHVPVAGLATGRDRALSGRGCRRETRAALAHLHHRHAVLPCRRLPHPLRTDAPPGGAAVQSGGAVGRRARPLLQHGRELHHQYQLAELRRRKHAVLPRADARPDAPELPVGGDRHRTRGRADPRLCARFGKDRRQFLGRYHPLHALHPHADLHRVRALPGLAGHTADAWSLCRSDHAGRRQADHRRRPGRLAGRHQDARHQRRRLLQRQCRPSVREPDGFVELRADDLHLRDRGRAHQCVRPHGRQSAPGLGDPCRDGRVVRRRCHGRLLGRGPRQRRIHGARSHRRQHGGQGGALRHRRLRAVRRRHHCRLVRRRQRHARTRSPRSAA